jgi:hypothetical protein
VGGSGRNSKETSKKEFAVQSGECYGTANIESDVPMQDTLIAASSETVRSNVKCLWRIQINRLLNTE